MIHNEDPSFYLMLFFILIFGWFTIRVVLPKIDLLADTLLLTIPRIKLPRFVKKLIGIAKPQACCSNCSAQCDIDRLAAIPFLKNDSGKISIGLSVCRACVEANNLQVGLIERNLSRKWAKSDIDDALLAIVNLGLA